MLYNATYAITPGGTYIVTIGAGGIGSTDRPYVGQSGTKSVFGSLIATGGGGGSSTNTGSDGV